MALSIRRPDATRMTPPEAFGVEPLRMPETTRFDRSQTLSRLMKPFWLGLTEHSDALIVDVSGEIDLATAPELTRALASVPDTVPRVVVNLSEVSFLDSSALNVLVHSRRRLDEQKIVFRVVGPADRFVRRVFEITHLTELLGVVGSLEEALTKTAA
jgi:anti-sigma B factor antagonist